MFAVGKRNSSILSRHEGTFVTIPSVPAATLSGDKSSVLKESVRGLSAIFMLNQTKIRVKKEAIFCFLKERDHYKGGKESVAD